jgi:hypothetical protein
MISFLLGDGGSIFCSVEMVSNKKLAAVIVVAIVVIVVGVAAYLLTRKYTLTVSVSPENRGSVSLSSGESTSVKIAVNFSPGASVTLTATPTSGYAFTNWEGDASGEDASVTVVMNANKVVTAHFVPTTD